MPRKLPVLSRLELEWEKRLEREGLGVIELTVSHRAQHIKIISDRPDSRTRRDPGDSHPASILENATTNYTSLPKFDYYYRWTHMANELPPSKRRTFLIHMGDTALSTVSAKACKVDKDTARKWASEFAREVLKCSNCDK